MGNIDKTGEGGAGPHLAPAASRVKRRLSVRALTGIGVGVAVLTLVGTAACAAPGSSAATTTRATDTAIQVPDVAWSSCPADQPGLAQFRCASISVPLNYADPGGRQITLGLVEHRPRRPATGQARCSSIPAARTSSDRSSCPRS